MGVLKLLLSVVSGSFGALGIKSLALLAGSTVTGLLTPVVTAVMAVLRGIVNIVIDLSKSFEGRVVLAALIAVCGFFYLRFHYIEEGKAREAVFRTQLVEAAVRQRCAAPAQEKRGTKSQPPAFKFPGLR
jgi:hypothetical protein